MLTDVAVAKVAELMAGEPEGTVLRIAVRPGGCSGFSYEMMFDTNTDPSDAVEAFDEGIRVVIDPESAPMLAGTTVDYKDGLDESGFKIDNPNATRSCGCGNSFS